MAQGKVDYVAKPTPRSSHRRPQRAGPGRYRVTANNWTERLALNTSRSLFADRRVRRAVAFAVDRRALAPASPAATFCRRALCCRRAPQTHAPGRGYPLGGDLNVARRLIGPRHHVRALFATYADATGAVFDPRFVHVLVRRLAAIGISVTVVPVRQTDGPAQQSALFSAARHRAGRRERLPDPRPGRIPALVALSPTLRSHEPPTDRGPALAAPRSRGGAPEFATELERDAIVIGVGNRATPELVSTRLGCVVEQPEYPGLDLAALCLPGTHG